MAHILAALMPEFQSTPSARRATRRRPEERLYRLHFNPRPPRGGRPDLTDLTAYALHISIHALREEGDTAVSFPASCRDNFNPRPPRGGRHRRWTACPDGRRYFNPRPPWGKRPDKPKTPAPAKQFQSAISTWKATTDKLIVYDEAYMISTHALREEGDVLVFATFDSQNLISIHALREEGDSRRSSPRPWTFYFNPRPPRGERRSGHRPEWARR